MVLRTGIPALLSDCPAVLARQSGQQAQHERPGLASGFYPAETAPDPGHQLTGHRTPAARVYAGISGHQKIIASYHQPG